jgi:hypothetical protein
MRGNITRLLDRLRGRKAESQPVEAPEPAEMPSEAPPRPQQVTDAEEMRAEYSQQQEERIDKPQPPSYTRP